MIQTEPIHKLARKKTAKTLSRPLYTLYNEFRHKTLHCIHREKYICNRIVLLIRFFFSNVKLYVSIVILFCA